MSLMISPGRACRSSLDFSKIGVPFKVTSNRPPRDGVSVTDASGNRSRISAAKLVARGS